MFVKVSNEILNNLDFISRQGIGLLREGMRNAKPFDPDNPFSNYEKKNEYFNEANNICQLSLWKLGLFDLCERYYTQLLKEIRDYERNQSTNFNKGMVYANLGVSQVAQGKIDEGFANLLKAHIEDEPYHKTNPTKSIFNLSLYKQFEVRTEDFILTHSQLFQNEESITLNQSYIDGLLSALDTDSRILYVSVCEKIRRHFEILRDKDNRFTRLQLFLCLQDLCLSIENALKIKNHLSGTLKGLIDTLFSTNSGRPRNWKSDFDSNYNLTSSNNATQFESNLRNIMAIGNVKARRLLICCAIRNFSSHNLDVGNDYVFNNLEYIFDNILSSSFFLKPLRCNPAVSVRTLLNNQ